MNTVEAAYYLAGNLNVPDPAQLPVDAAFDVLRALNGGIQAYYREVSAIYKRTTLSHTFRAPETLEITAVAKYGHELTEDVFSAAMRGCSVRIPGAPVDNEVVSSRELLDEWLVDDLTASATVFYDAAHVEDVIQRITGEVRIYGDGIFASGAYGILYRDEDLRRNRFQRLEMGRPTHYMIDPVGASSGAEPEFLLRVWPPPAADCLVRFEAELGPRRIAFAELTNAVKLPVPGERVEDILLPLCEAELLRSRFWRDQSQASLVMERAANVLGRKLRYVPGDIAPTGGRVGTPKGF